jgi:hypothetical protein
MAVTTSEFKPPGGKRLETQRKTVGGTVSVWGDRKWGRGREEGRRTLKDPFLPLITFSQAFELEEKSGEGV